MRIPETMAISETGRLLSDPEIAKIKIAFI